MSDMDGYIITYTGVKFTFADPQPDDIRIVDIAHGLSLTNRWGGHTMVPMNVAHHSLIVRALLRNQGYRLQLLAMLHDASEAYLPDMPSPIKPFLPQFVELENRVEDCVWRAFDMCPPAQDEKKLIKAADVESYRWEARDLLAFEGAVLPPHDERPTLVPMTAQAAEVKWTQVLAELMFELSCGKEGAWAT